MMCGRVERSIFRICIMYIRGSGLQSVCVVLKMLQEGRPVRRVEVERRVNKLKAAGKNEVDEITKSGGELG